MYDIPQLEYFRMVAKYQNMTKAAEELHVAQPNLSSAIHKLESTLGVKLFDRTRGRVYLNAYGKIYLDAVNKAMDCLEQGEHQIHTELVRNSRGRIVMASSMQIFNEDLTEMYYKKHPESLLFINQDLANLDFIPGQLKKGMVDIAIVPECDLPGNTKAIKLFDFEICVLMSKQHPLASSGTVRFCDIRDMPFVCNNLGINSRSTVEFCRMAGFSPNVIFESSDFKSVGHWIERGKGISLISSYDMLKLVNQGFPIACARISEPTLVLNMNLVRRTDRVYSVEEEQFIKYLSDYYRTIGEQHNNQWQNYILQQEKNCIL